MHGDVAGELRDAVRHALVVAHREVGGKAGVQARTIRCADDNDGNMSAAEDRQDFLEIGRKTAVGDDDRHIAGIRGERRAHLGLGATVACGALAGRK